MTPERHHRVPVLGDRHEQAGDHLHILGVRPPGTLGGIVDDLGHRRHIARGQPVEDHAVGLAPGQSQHALPQRGDVDRHRLAGHHAQAEPLDAGAVNLGAHLVAGQRRPQEAHHVAHLVVRPIEVDAVPALDDDVRRRAQAEGEAAGCRLSEGANRLGQQRRAPGEGGDDGGAEAHRRRPHRGECQRREGVCAHRFGRPQVGVSGILQLDEPVPLFPQRYVVERNGHPQASHVLTIGPGNGRFLRYDPGTAGLLGRPGRGTIRRSLDLTRHPGRQPARGGLGHLPHDG